MASIQQDIASDIPRPDTVPYTDAGMFALAKYARDGWVLWEQQSTKKVPMVNGRYVNEAAKAGALLTFAQARVQYETRRGGCRGLGVYLRAPVVGIDLDDVVTWRDGQPVYSVDALAIMGLLPTYTELSPSGTGLHLYVHYDGDHNALPNTRHYRLPHGGKIAIFAGTNMAYLTVTGRSVGEITGILDVTPDDMAAITKYTTADRLIEDTTKPAPVATSKPAPTPAPTPPTDNTPTPAPVATSKPAQPATAPAPAGMVKYDAVPRMLAWMDIAWPARVKDDCEQLADTVAGMIHDNRCRYGMHLGASFRVLELLCDAVGVPRHRIPAPSSLDDIITELYKAKEPQGDAKTKRTERRTIETAVQHGYDDRDVTIHSWSKPTPPALAKILHDASIVLPAPAPTPPTDHTPTPAPVAASKPAPATAEIIINFDDIMTPHDDAINALVNDIRQHGITAAMLFSTAADVMATAGDMPPPVIASIHDNAHLLMPGVCSLSAPSKIGKSTMALHLAYAVATGGDVFGSPKYKARQGTAVYFDLENFTPLTGTRMAEMYDTPPPLYRHVTSKQWNSIRGIATRQHVDRWRAMQWYITQTLKQWPDTRLLILDNVIQFQPVPQRGETPRDVEERYIRWLAGVADMHPDLCIMLIDHNTKMQSTDKTDKDMLHDKQQGTFIKRALLTGGTISISKTPPNTDVPDGALTVSTSPRACAALDIIVKLDATHGHHVLLDVKPLQMSKQQRQIYEAIRNGHNTPKAISDVLQMNASTITNQIDRMRAKGLIYREHYGTYAPAEASHRYTPQTTQAAIDDDREAF